MMIAIEATEYDMCNDKNIILVYEIMCERNRLGDPFRDRVGVRKGK